MTKLRLCYQTVEFGKTDIHLCTLRDKQEFDDPQGAAEKLGISLASWPLFGVVWPSSMVLAHYISDYNTGTKRILENGCGRALSSLLLNKKLAILRQPTIIQRLGFSCSETRSLTRACLLTMRKSVGLMLKMILAFSI